MDDYFEQLLSPEHVDRNDLDMLAMWCAKTTAEGGASICSGTDCPVLALRSLSRVLARRGIVLPTYHGFSCEADPKKRAFLMRRDPSKTTLFTDALDLPSMWAFNVIPSRWQYVLRCGVLWGGVPCQDASTLNSNSNNVGEGSCIENGTHRTGAVFRAILQYARAAGVEVIVLENVLGLGMRKKGQTYSNAQWALCHLNDPDYGDFFARCFEVHPRFFGSPVHRGRLYFIGLSRGFLRKCGWTDQRAEAEMIRIFRRMLDTWHLEPLESYCLPDSHWLVKQHLAQCRARRWVASSTSKTAGTSCKWFRRHLTACRQKRVKWHKLGREWPEKFKLFPGLKVLCTRELEMLSINGVTVPAAQHEQKILDVSQAWLRPLRPGHCSIVTPNGRLLHTGRGRLLTGFEKLLFQGLAWRDEEAVQRECAKINSSLAGNAFEFRSFSAAFATGLIFRAVVFCTSLGTFSTV